MDQTLVCRDEQTKESHGRWDALRNGSCVFLPSVEHHHVIVHRSLHVLICLGIHAHASEPPFQVFFFFSKYLCFT